MDGIFPFSFSHFFSSHIQNVLSGPGIFHESWDEKL